MLEYKYSNSKVDSNTKIIVKNVSSLVKLIRKLRKQNIEFEITTKRNFFEVSLKKLHTAKKANLNRAIGANWIVIDNVSINEIIPTTTNIPPPPSKKGKEDLSDR